MLLLIEANAHVTHCALCRALDIQRANMTPLTAKARVAIAEFEDGLIARIPVAQRPHAIRVLMALWRRN